MKQAMIVVAVLVLLGVAFWGGTVYANAGSDSASTGIAAGPGGGFAGGPMANLSDEERAKIDAMTDEERQAYFQEQFGDSMPAPGDAGAGGLRMRGGLIEGEVLDVATDAVTIKLADGGSQNIYIDSDTVLAFTETAGELAAGAQVMISATPEADGVTTATLVVVK